MTRTGYTIDLTQLSSTIENLRNKYEASNQSVSFLRARNKFKGTYKEKEIEQKEFKMDPSQFGAIVKTILQEKLRKGLGVIGYRWDD